MSRLDALLPRQRLQLILTALCRRLPTQVGELLDASRFAEARGALLRLADPRWAGEATTAMTEEEADWLARELWNRWSSVGTPVLDPTAYLTIPEEIWIGTAPVRLSFELIVIGVDDGWTVTWSGSVIGTTPPALLIEPPRRGAPWRAAIQASVRARMNQQPIELGVSGEIRLRRPSVVFRGDRCLMVRDQAGQPAVQVRVQVGDLELETCAAGTVQLERVFPANTPVCVEGLLVGRVPLADHALEEPTLEMRR